MAAGGRRNLWLRRKESDDAAVEMGRGVEPRSLALQASASPLGQPTGNDREPCLGGRCQCAGAPALCRGGFPCERTT